MKGKSTAPDGWYMTWDLEKGIIDYYSPKDVHHSRLSQNVKDFGTLTLADLQRKQKAFKKEHPAEQLTLAL